MARRWLSTRGRKAEQNQEQNMIKAQGYQYSKPTSSTAQRDLESSSETAQSELLRFTTSENESQKFQHKPDLTLLIERPQSSHSTSHSSSHPTTHSDGSQKGLASSSPRNALQISESIERTTSSAQQRTVQPGRSWPTRTRKPRKWNIVPFFRPRANSSRELGFDQVLASDFPEAEKPNARTGKDSGKNLNPIPVADDNFEEQVLNRISKDGSNTPLDIGYAATDVTMNSAGDCAHALQVEIPVTPLERFSVMFKDFGEPKQSGLLQRRSNGPDQLSIETKPCRKNTKLAVPRLTRRVSSPVTSQPSRTTRLYNHPGTGSKYSLFPVTPVSTKIPSRNDSPQSYHDRPATAPAQLSPSQDGSFRQRNILPQTCTVNNVIDNPARLGSEVFQTLLPEELTTSTTSHHSRDSTRSEIFFDVQSFRDSSGQVGQQFEMTRPPSAVVQLARSKSNARKLHEENTHTNTNTDGETENSLSKSTSDAIDETIAIVKGFTTLQASASSMDHIPEQRLDQASCEVGDAQGYRSVVHEVRVELPLETKIKRRSSPNPKTEGRDIDMSIPVSETAEGDTNPMKQPTAMDRVSPETRHDIFQTHKESISQHTQSCQSRRTTDSPLPPLPHIPIRNSKHIPLSKYAPKHTTADLVRQTGLRPVRPDRSNTVNSPTCHPQTSSIRRPPYQGRSTTMPSLSTVPQPKQILPAPVVAGPGTSGTGPTVIAYIKPAAEVSIARTVSLSRTPSARVIGPKIPIRNYSKREASQEQVTERNVTLGIPVLQEVQNRHKLGLSMAVVLETAGTAPSSPTLPVLVAG